MNRLPISVFIIALNEGDRIARSIASVHDWVDEVIVIDSGSSDDTVAASQKAGARVLHNAWPGYGLQKRFGEEQCRNDWLFNIDADEVVSDALAQEIKELFNAGLRHSAYWLDIAEILPGRKKPGLFTHRVHAIRLYDKRAARFDASSVHDSVRVERGTEGQLKHLIEHRASRGLAHSLDKVNRYSTMQAENAARGDSKIPFARLRLPIEFWIGFFKAYVLRGYILQGRQGFVNSMLYGFSRFIRVAKYLEQPRRMAGSGALEKENQTPQ